MVPINKNLMFFLPLKQRKFKISLPHTLNLGGLDMDVELNSHKIQKFSLSWRCPDREHTSLNAHTEWTIIQDESAIHILNGQGPT